MKGTHARLSLAVGLFGILGLVGCDTPGLSSKHAKSPSSLAQEPIGQATNTSAAMAPLGGGTGHQMGVGTTGLSVSDEIAQACGIPARADGKGMNPSFDFDSAALGPDDREMLAQVARCLTEGGLRGRSVTLVGRTDPRGEPEYNMNLGGSRADSVRRYVQDLGVGKDRLATTSRGELDATGKDEPSWALDRRVDIQLVK